MSSVLVVYAGAGAEVADAIATTLRSMHIAVDVVNLAGAMPSPEPYAGFVVVTDTIGGGYPQAVATWLRANVTTPGTRPTAFVTICPAAHDAVVAKRQSDEVARGFVADTRWPATILKSAAPLHDTAGRVNRDGAELEGFASLFGERVVRWSRVPAVSRAAVPSAHPN